MPPAPGTLLAISPTTIIGWSNLYADGMLSPTLVYSTTKETIQTAALTSDGLTLAFAQASVDPQDGSCACLMQQQARCLRRSRSAKVWQFWPSAQARTCWLPVAAHRMARLRRASTPSLNGTCTQGVVDSRRWQYAKLEALATMTSFSATVRSLAFTPGGRSLPPPVARTGTSLFRWICRALSRRVQSYSMDQKKLKTLKFDSTGTYLSLTWRGR